MAGHPLFSREILSLAFWPTELTAREREVLKLLAEGKTDREIAAALVLSLPTVRKHSQKVLEKLDVHERREAVRRARRLGWF
jgi:DNA-binding NarL/FixJ family response regulator